MSLYFDNNKLFDAEGHLTDDGLYALKDGTLDDLGALWGAVSTFGVPDAAALLPQQPAARQERFGTKFNTAVNGFYKSLDDTFKSFTLTAENGLDQIRAQSIGGSTAKGE